jgi:hypothetical protein
VVPLLSCLPGEVTTTMFFLIRSVLDISWLCRSIRRCQCSVIGKGLG